ncbi:MAG: MFS transporter, partial [Betaproteobacteria bacterium]|nr:MFS transporter [Betaproteobacteria bacterium]
MLIKLPTLRALRHRNFALFIAGQVCALIGFWMQSIAQSWLLYKMTDSATLLGVLGFAGSLPILLLAPFAGLWSDRCNLHKVMFATQILEMLQAITLATLALTGLLEPWHIIALAMFMGVLIAVELPVRHAYLVELVDGKEDLPNAIAVTSLMANCGRLAGPALAGLVIAWLGEAACFAINALSYITVMISFLMIKVTPTERAASSTPMLQGMREGLTYAWGSLPIRSLLLLLTVVGLLGTPYISLMPVLVREVFAGGADQMGFLVGAAGLGAVSGTLFLAARSGVRGLVRLLTYAALAAGVALALVAHVKLVWFALPLLAITGFGILVTSVSVNMIVQAIVDDDKRGRVMSLYTVAFMGMSPFGALAAGALADVIGVAATLTISGACCALGALILATRHARLRGELKQIYARLG